MKTKFLAIGLLGAALAATAVFADDATTTSAPAASSSAPATSNTPAVDSNAAPAAAPVTQGDNGQTTTQ